MTPETPHFDPNGSEPISEPKSYDYSNAEPAFSADSTEGYTQTQINDLNEEWFEFCQNQRLDPTGATYQAFIKGYRNDKSRRKPKNWADYKYKL